MMNFNENEIEILKNCLVEIIIDLSRAEHGYEISLVMIDGWQMTSPAVISMDEAITNACELGCKVGLPIEQIKVADTAIQHLVPIIGFVN